jgi:small ligand-binding sensory domain FIST
MACASALSTERDSLTALDDVASRVAAEFGSEPADLAVVFASPHHVGAFERIAATLHARDLARHVIGCTGEAIVGEDREVEGSPALSFWALRLPGVGLTPRRLSAEAQGLRGLPSAGDPDEVLILLGDPFTYPTDDAFKRLKSDVPALRVVGGMASAAGAPGGNRLLLNGEVFDRGAVAVGMSSVAGVRTVVSQGCRPVGRTLIVTKTERNVIRELGRRPALDVLRELFQELSPDDQERVQQGLHLGRVIDEYRESFLRGDFLVRNVLGADDAGGIAVTDVPRVGQTVQFHVRDAASADEDLRGLLASERAARPDAKLSGALLFTCNGRGTRLFDEPNHDVGVIQELLGPIPVAGFFAMGELGPVGGQNFVHGYTASVVLFEEA